MCLRFVFLLTTRAVSWLRLSRRDEAWKTAEILILRHQLAALQRQQRGRVKLCWADRALLAALLGLIPKAQWDELRLLVTRARCCAGIATSSPAAGPQDPCPEGRAGLQPSGTSRPWFATGPREPDSGYRRIHREMAGLGVKVAVSTVWEILRVSGNAPPRG
jgi:putative transposase